MDSLQLEHEWQVSAEVQSADISPDEAWVAAVCGDGTIRVWDRKNGSNHPQANELGIFSTSESRQVWVSFTPDSRALLAIDGDQRLSVWSLEDGTLLTNDLKHDLFPTRQRSLPKFQRNGHWLAHGRASSSRWWIPATGK